MKGSLGFPGMLRGCLVMVSGEHLECSLRPLYSAYWNSDTFSPGEAENLLCPPPHGCPLTGGGILPLHVHFKGLPKTQRGPKQKCIDASPCNFLHFMTDWTPHLPKCHRCFPSETAAFSVGLCAACSVLGLGHEDQSGHMSSSHAFFLCSPMLTICFLI